jgi:hypothetical protein
MMTLLRSNKIFLGALLAAGVLVAGFWFGVLAPKRQEASAIDAQIATKQDELATAQQRMASYEKARASYKANYAKLVSLGAAVPGDDDVRSLMVELDAASSESNVEFQRVNVGGGSSAAATPSTAGSTTSGVGPGGQLATAPALVPVGSTGVSALPFSFTFDGTFLNLSDFFSRIERFVAVRNEKVSVKGRLLRVESFGIVPSGSGWPRMAATVGAASYVVTPVASPSAKPGAAGNAGAAASTPASSGGTSSPSTTTATVTGVAR